MDKLFTILIIVNSIEELNVLEQNPLINRGSQNFVVVFTNQDLNNFNFVNYFFSESEDIISILEKVFIFSSCQWILLLKPYEIISEFLHINKLENSNYYIKVETHIQKNTDNNLICYEKRLFNIEKFNLEECKFIEIKNEINHEFKITNYFYNFYNLEKELYERNLKEYNNGTKRVNVLIYLSKNGLILNLENILHNKEKYVFESNSQIIELYIEIIRLLIKTNIFDKAESYLFEALIICPNSLTLNYLLSEIYLKKKLTEKSIYYLKKIIDLSESGEYYKLICFPKSLLEYEPYYKLGKLFYEKDEYVFSNMYLTKGSEKYKFHRDKFNPLIRNNIEELKNVDNYVNIYKSLLIRDREFYESYLENKNNKNILICNTGNRNTFSMEILLSIALKLRNVNVHIFICDKSLKACELDENYNIDEYENFAEFGHLRNECEQCFLHSRKAFNNQNVKIHYYSDYVSKEEKKEIDLIVENTNVEDIRRFEYKGVNIGEHAYSGALRFFARGDLENTEYSNKVLKRYFHSALFTFIATQNLLDKYKFECSVSHHGIYVPFGVIGEVFRKNKVRVVNWCRAYRSKRFVFSHEDTYHKTLIKENVENWENIEFNEYLEEKTIKYIESRFTGLNDWINFHNKKDTKEVEQLEKLFGIDFKKPCIALLTNVIWDAQLHFEESIFENMMDWIIQTVKYFETRKDLQLIIRVHPAEITGLIPSKQKVKSELLKYFINLPKNIFIIDSDINLNTYQIVRNCNSTIIYGTKTGLEIATEGIPVIVAGESCVREKGITIDPKTKEEYFNILNELPFKSKIDKESILRAKKYAFHYFFRKMIPIEFIEFEKSKDVTFYRSSIDSLKKLLSGNFKGLDVICEGIINNSEFIYPAENYHQELEELI